MMRFVFGVVAVLVPLACSVAVPLLFGETSGRDFTIWWLGAGGATVAALCASVAWGEI